MFLIFIGLLSHLQGQMKAPTYAGAGLEINPAILQEIAEGDSAEAPKKYILPIWGNVAREKGIDIPHPVGVNLSYMWQNFDIDISNLGLSFGDDPTIPIDFVTFEAAGTNIHSGNLRADVWLLPFLNISGMFGVAQGTTNVALRDPIPFETAVDYRGQYYGFGVMGAYGIERTFFTADVNWTWFDSELTKEPVAVTVAGLRAGYSIPVGKTNLAVWTGSMLQDYTNDTRGSIALEEALPLEEVRNELSDYQNSTWYQDLGRPKQRLVDETVQNIVDQNLGSTEINYSIDKRPSAKWNVLIGTRWEINKNFELRAEGGFIGRNSLLVNAVYRFPI